MIQILKTMALCCMIFLWSCALHAQSNITNVEYYIDTDPGYGNGTPVTISQGINLSNLTATVDLSALSSGVHLFGVRAKDAKGAWSIDNKWLFVKNEAAVTTPKIINAEYYIDSDPGYGNATPISISSDTNLSNLNTNINPATLATGVHLFGIRAKDANGAWSLDNKWLFVKDAATLDTPNIVRVEYYVDTDPGYGKAFSANISQVKNLADIMQNVNLQTLGNGAHFIGIRALDANGAWSLDNKLSFIINGPLPITFTNFSGRYINDANQLTVEIQQALNVKVVQVEKSIDGTHFTYVGDIATAPVTSGTYKYDDKNPVSEINFYRLSIVDNDGKISYSYIISVEHTSAFVIQMYPNPVQDNLIIHFENANSGTYNIKVTDVGGKNIFSHKVNVSQNIQNGDVNISFSIYSAGIYFIQVTDQLNKIITTQKIIKK